MIFHYNEKPLRVSLVIIDWEEMSYLTKIAKPMFKLWDGLEFVFSPTWADNVDICTEGSGLFSCLLKSFVHVLVMACLYDYKYPSRSWLI